MDTQRMRVALKILDTVKTQFPDTKQFIEDSIDQQCLKENISADEVIFLQVQKQRAQKKKIYFVVSILRDILLC